MRALKFYDSKYIPKYEQEEPLRITNTKYYVFLEGLSEEKIEEWMKKSGLINQLDNNS